MEEFNKYVGDVEILWEKVIHCFNKFPQGVDDVFLRATRNALKNKQLDFYEFIEYVREKLNSGYWRDVPVFWRESYAVLRLASVLSHISTSNNYEKCDLEYILWLLDDALIMGHSDDLHQTMTKLASLVNGFLTEQYPFKTFPKTFSDIDSPSPDLSAFTYPNEVISELKRIHQPSLSEFTDILKAGIPIIITGAMTHWPACNISSDRYWSPDYWSRTLGYRTVPIEIGSAYTDESWGQRLLTVNQFFDTFIVNPTKNQPTGYLAQHQILLQIPELADDVDIPDYCFTGTIDGASDSAEVTVDSNIWVGPANTVSPLHHDSDRANVLCQLIGRKYVKLYNSDQAEFIYPHTDNSMLCNTSQLDVASKQPDFEKFPKFKLARGYHGVLGPGEMLFIPPRAWHYIRALTSSISMNFWWCVDDSFIPPWPDSYKF